MADHIRCLSLVNDCELLCHSKHHLLALTRSDAAGVLLHLHACRHFGAGFLICLVPVWWSSKHHWSFEEISWAFHGISWSLESNLQSTEIQGTCRCRNMGFFTLVKCPNCLDITRTELWPAVVRPARNLSSRRLETAKRVRRSGSSNNNGSGSR